MNTVENFSPRHRLSDLLIKKSTCGLEVVEYDDLSGLLDQMKLSISDMEQEVQQLELTAAAVDLAIFNHDSEPLPPDIREKLLLHAGQRFFIGDESLEFAGQELGENPESDSDDSKVQRKPLPTSPPNWREILSILAAAACIVILLFNWNKIVSPQAIGPTVAQIEKQFGESPPSDLFDAQWKPGPDPNGANVTGRLAWSTQEQTGFMTFKGMKANDPSEEQYQLWIFEDPEQEFPIDGGVFDIADKETKIRIDPKIKVDQGVFFAVTVEIPGGVVVSDRSRIAAVATAGQ